MIDIKPKNILEQPIYLLTKATPCPYLKGKVENLKTTARGTLCFMQTEKRDSWCLFLSSSACIVLHDRQKRSCSRSRVRTE